MRKKWELPLFVAANCALILAVINGLIVRKQAVIDSGRTVFLELAPVDPRSLIQGDYMILDYAFPREDRFREKMRTAPTRGRVILSLNSRSIGTFSRVDDGAEEKLSRNEVGLKYRKWRRGWKFGIESFFFEEGSGERYGGARYAELRVSPAGEAVLVDLRGDRLAPLGGE